MNAKNEQSWEEKLQEQMQKLEKKVEDLSNKLDDQSGKITKNIGEKTSSATRKIEKQKSRHSIIWGIIFIALGLLWLGESLHWFYDLPLIPIIIIIIGILLIVKDLQTNESSSTADKKI